MPRAPIEAALRRDPSDEHAWAVFGDLLSAEGDARGELIALIQRAAASDKPFERSVLEHRATELFEREHRRWLGPLADAGLEVTWSRGFATEVVIARRHAATLDELLALPTSALLHKLTFVRPRGLGPIVRALRDRPIVAIEIRMPQADSLAEIAALEQLRELAIDGGSSEGVEALAQLPALRSLTLRRCTGPLVGLAGGFAALRELDLSARENAGALGPDALAPLAELASIERLILRDGGWSVLDPLGDLSALEVLDLRSTDVADLAPLARLTELRELDLSGCTEVANIEALANLAKLERLELAYTRVRSLRPLARAHALQTTELSGTPIHDLRPLFSLPALRKVGVEACEIDSIEPLVARGISVVGVRTPEPTWRDLAEGLLRTNR